MLHTGLRTVDSRRRIAAGGAVLAFTLLLIPGCSSKPQNEPVAQQAPAAAAPVPLTRRLGWLHGNCLAIANETLARDAAVTVVMLGDDQKIVDAQVTGPTTSSEICPALLDDRRSTNAGTGLSFYELRAAPGLTFELGIGVVGNVARVGSGLDVSGDGVAEQFTQCATSEGVSFAVWSGAPYQGTPLWSAYYYVGYDSEVTCPSPN